MKNNRLYNVLFPAWLFYLFPTGVWLLILPGNFLIDSIVIYCAARFFNISECVSLWKKSILKVWIIGFISDIIGALLILAIYLLSDKFCPGWNTFNFPGATIIAIPGVLLSAVCIFFINRRFAFSQCGLDDTTITRLSRTLALLTAPYAMLIPLYG
ncbi:hypothetical protein D081_2014 [Anaerovibrio sp. JC8]|uniref:hypothetical protein n=1 Tax=Anaerovibrio sp. JC8 TaxID=1240085 RepID=UPI000A0B5722|nr:hypothetical protein [Anaerovibrio sp. JC8]ORT99285.1 hypothetical protein D081_2014 [Anaerovibrio sp. JC8]